MAVNRKFSGKNGEVKETAWFSVSAWGKLAEACGQYLKRGSKVLVTGRLRIDPATGGPRTFQKKDGSIGASYEVTADDITFLSGNVGEDGREPVDMSAPRPAAQPESSTLQSPAAEDFVF
jgi:single-strand DNA-binding protein